MSDVEYIGRACQIARKVFQGDRSGSISYELG